MTDIPQPSSTPYTPGDRVRTYVGPHDPDAQYHGLVCEVRDVRTDALDAETGRPLDAYSYTVVAVETDEQLPVEFRHRDLVPVDASDAN